MKRYLILLSAATLGLAAAQTGTTTISLPGTVPASVTRAQADDLAKFLAAGGEIRLVNAAGNVIGTLGQDGRVTLTAGATLADARTVQAVPPAGQGEPVTYTLARDLSRPGAIKFEVKGPNGKVQSLPLSAIVNRQSGTKTEDGRADAGRGEKAEKPEKEEKEKPENPGNGKDKSPK